MMHTPIQKHMSIVVISAILLVAGVAGFVRFAILMQAKKNNVIAAKQQLISYEQNKKIFSEESLALATIGSRVAVLESYRITSATTPALLSSLEALAQKDGIDFTINSVQTPGGVAGKAVEPKLLIDFSAKGNAEHVDMFLRDLSHQTYQIKFTKFSLFVDGTRSSNADLVAPAVSKKQVSTTGWQVSASIQIISF